MGADICNGHPWLNRFQEGLMDKDGRKGPQAALVNSGCREGEPGTSSQEMITRGRPCSISGRGELL